MNGRGSPASFGLRPSLRIGALLLVGCAGSTEPIDYTRYFRAGVEVAEEAEAIRAGFIEHEWLLDRRLDGDGFAALVFSRTGEYAVRVVTARGVGIAVGGEGHHQRLHVEGLDGTREGRVNGRELLLGERDSTIPRTCLLRIRVDRDGGARTYAVTPMGEDPDACVEAYDDLFGDPELEALVVLRERRLSRGEVPAVPVPMVLDEEQYRLASGDRLASYCASLRTQRQEEVQVGRTRGDFDTAFRVAVELAILSRVCGGSRADQLRSFTEALAGLVLSEEQAGATAAARTLIRAGFAREGSTSGGGVGTVEGESGDAANEGSAGEDSVEDDSADDDGTDDDGVSEAGVSEDSVGEDSVGERAAPPEATLLPE
ncbi:MAG: hypothetical protein AAGF12_27840 [Myxococcota bacterium]